MGDGYQNEEYVKFIENMNYLSDGLVHDTSPFTSFVPLLNIWAVFTPSLESGIGSHDRPKVEYIIHTGVLSFSLAS